MDFAAVVCNDAGTSCETVRVRMGESKEAIERNDKNEKQWIDIGFVVRRRPHASLCTVLNHWAKIERGVPPPFIPNDVSALISAWRIQQRGKQLAINNETPNGPLRGGGFGGITLPIGESYYYQLISWNMRDDPVSRALHDSDIQANVTNGDDRHTTLQGLQGSYSTKTNPLDTSIMFQTATDYYWYMWYRWDVLSGYFPDTIFDAYDAATFGLTYPNWLPDYPYTEEWSTTTIPSILSPNVFPSIISNPEITLDDWNLNLVKQSDFGSLLEFQDHAYGWYYKDGYAIPTGGSTDTTMLAASLTSTQVHPNVTTLTNTQRKHILDWYVNRETPGHLYKPVCQA